MSECTESMNKAYLLTGGNEGNRLSQLLQAITNIEKYCGEIVRHSSLYETAAWGKTDQPAFINQALLLETKMTAPELMKAILDIEERMGRKRMLKYGPRTIDIDILFFNEEIINQPTLQIPHPEMQNRRFVLVPMNELAPDLIHPVFGKSIKELLLECADPLDVKKI
jgi:2-amino-4-hydroxy-6-hydroxymethyldihydropteridine diphosphokinase